MRLFISHAFGEESYLYTVMKGFLDANGFVTWDVADLQAKLARVTAHADDYYELKDAFYRAGYPFPRGFEASDPAMRELLISNIGTQDAVIVLWSRHHAFRFWTAVERTTAVVMCKLVVFVLVDDTPLPDDLQPAITKHGIPTITLADYLNNPHLLISTLNSLVKTRTGCITHEIMRDAMTAIEFVRLGNTVFGDWEVSRCPLTNAQVERHWPQHREKRCSSSSDDDEPAVRINWEEANHLCQTLSTDSKTYRYRLPTEVEWEFAARAGDSTYYGYDPHLLKFDRVRTTPVGTMPNKWGICDCVGNVGQWTDSPSRWREYNGWYRPAEPINIEGRMSDYHTVKGSYYLHTRNPRSLSEACASPSLLVEDVVGIRLVREGK